MKFSSLLWDKITPLYSDIQNHPFNVELADGTLDFERFQFYIEQDSFYLIQYAKALAAIASRSHSAALSHQFLNFSINALVFERELHAQFLPREHQSEKIEPSPACLAYTTHLLAAAQSGSLEEGIAAVLPCFWIYKEVGQSVVECSQKDNPYSLWIDTYSSPDFAEDTNKAILILDTLAEKGSSSLLEKMEKAFELSAFYEWHFWNDAYEMKRFRDSGVKIILDKF